MKNFKKVFSLRNSKGFTLIELLVVIAIIGILASISFVLLNNAKKKGDDAAVQSNLNAIKAESELFASDHGYSFGDSFSIDTCPLYEEGTNNIFKGNKKINDAIKEAVARGGNGSSCYNSSSQWAVAVGLKSSIHTCWCIDSSGIAKQINSPANLAISRTTFSCVQPNYDPNKLEFTGDPQID